MATTKKAETTAAESTEETTAEKTTAKAATAVEKKFPLDNLAKNCRQLFGVSSCTFAGATAGLTGEYSVSEMKSIISEWCGKGAK